MSMGICLFLDSQPEFPRTLYNAGKDLIECSEALTEIADMLHVRTIMDFYSLNRTDAISEFGGEDWLQDMEGQGELLNGRWYSEGRYLWSVEQEWFSATDGLKTMTALREHIETAPTVLGEDAEEEEITESVVLALKDIEELLQDAVKKKRCFFMGLH